MSKLINSLYIILCLLSYTSCQGNEANLVLENVESSPCMSEQRVNDLILQVRNGDTEAYKSLAYCYRDGDGVEKSYLNAIFMYLVYCQKMGLDLDAAAELYDEGHPYRLLIEILTSSGLDGEVEQKIARLQQLSMADAEVLVPMREFLMNGKDNNVLEILKEAENEGSELAGAMQIIYFEEVKDSVGYQQCLNRLAEKHPFLNMKMAELYGNKYDENEDFSCIRKAMEYYYKADAYGMLSPKGANKLWSIYDYFSWKGMLEYDEDELERIKKIVFVKRNR